MEQENFTRRGYIYILINPAYPRYVKIGRTTKDPEIRAKEISSGTGVPAHFEVAWDVFVKNCDDVERIVHQKLDKHRAGRNREFFAIKLKEAISIISEIVGPFICKEEHTTNVIVEPDILLPELSTNHKSSEAEQGQINNENDKDILSGPKIKKDVPIMTKGWSPTQKNRVAFFHGLLQKSKGKTPLFSDISPESGYDGSLCKSAGLSKVLFKYYKPVNEGVIQLTIERNKREETEAIYDYLFERKKNIEEEFGDKLKWSELGNKRAAIEIRYNGGDLSFPETWPKLQDTMIDAMIRFHKALSTRIDEFKRINTFLKEY